MLIVNEKEVIRKQLLERLLSLNLSEVERRSKNVEERLQRLSYYIRAECIMGYYPLKGEVNILGILRKVLDEKRICFPRIKGNDLFPYQVKDLDGDFIPGPFGVKHPDPHTTSPVRSEELDLVIVPGIAFDRTRNRLGRGAGFYDRFLRTLSTKTPPISSTSSRDSMPTPRLFPPIRWPTRPASSSTQRLRSLIP